MISVDPSAESSSANLVPATLTRVAESIAHLGFKPINHVLSQHQWARDKLLMHVGKAVRIGVALDASALVNAAFLPPAMSERLANSLQQAPNVVDAQIAEDGTLIPLPLLTPNEVRAGVGGVPAVTMLVKPSFETLKSALNGGAAGLQPHLSIDGDVMLAAALGEIAQSARWDFEDDLSFLVGDKISHRIGQASAKIDAQVQQIVPKLMPHLTKSLDELGKVLEKLSSKLPAR